MVVYADDTTFVSIGNELEIVIESVNDRLNQLTRWCKFNRLALNIAKTKFMIFSPRPFNVVPELKINGINV